jgi:uncharacterized protein YebE (UPF0316 family)
MELFLLCVKIFFARITDVTLGTIKTVYSVRGKTIKAGCLTFIEIMIWFIVAREALNTDYNSIWIAVAYAGGCTAGNVIGTLISSKLVNTLISVEVTTSKATIENINRIRNEGFGVSVVNTTSSYNDTDNNLLFITLNSRNLDRLKQVIKEIDPNAFMVVNEAKIVQNGFVK